MKRYFDLSIDVYVPGRWYLGAPVHQDGREIDDLWRFSAGRPVEVPGRLRIPIYRAGVPLDFSTAGPGQAPVVSERVASLLRELAPDDVQLFPVAVEGETQPFFLLNVAREIRCIDDEASEEVQYFTEADGLPDKVGRYRSVIGLRIDKSKVGAARVFRLWGNFIPIVVDEDIKDALEANGIRGGQFEEV
ncbi:hypothetical protein LZ198_38380 [Myxococcus sp. K15C18031901]|uniref:imm11 family protein n=1 Tax=Myxococcus dinghuensis TaxID=2906761 RepID=UPI0020A73FFF|nr:DUF1629 domain-containing protein [Myxococcus dinghuensis]MCP3104750.1 hypothetical protein [Myxococcus dinghuensis]